MQKGVIFCTEFAMVDDAIRRNHGKPWTVEDHDLLHLKFVTGSTLRAMCIDLQRSAVGVICKLKSRNYIAQEDTLCYRVDRSKWYPQANESQARLEAQGKLLHNHVPTTGRVAANFNIQAEAAMQMEKLGLPTPYQREFLYNLDYGALELRALAACNKSTGRAVDTHQGIGQTTITSGDRGMPSFVISNSTSSCFTFKESVMSANIETKVFIDGMDASKLTDEQIFSKISQLETVIDGYAKIKNQPDKLKGRITAIEQDIKALVKYVDLR